MKLADFELYKKLLHESSGLVITVDKSYLLESRLTPIAKKWGYPSLETMTVTLRGIPDPALLKDVIEAVATPETSFFRDENSFILFRDVVLPNLAKKRNNNRSLRIWCAAASTGQEPYSLAITVLENQRIVPGWSIEILATDISGSLLDKADSGTYSQFELQQGLPVRLLLKYFEQQDDGWKIKDEPRKMVRFQISNLLDDMTPLGLFDVILCRNVLDCFDDQTKTDVLSRMAERLPSDGFLILGKNEDLPEGADQFKPLENCSGLYVQSDNMEDIAQAAKATTARS